MPFRPFNFFHPIFMVKVRKFCIKSFKNLFNISIDELLDDNFDIPVPEKKKRKRAPKPEAAPAPKAEPVKAAPAPAPKAEPVKAAPAPAPKVEPEVKPEPKVDSVPAPTEIDLNDLKESDENTKKVGFFGRIFGRK